MGQIALGYPLSWGYLFLPGYKAEVIYALAPFLLAPVFTYFYARQLGRSVLASLLAGLAFGYGGMMAGMLSNSGYTTNSVMWMRSEERRVGKECRSRWSQDDGKRIR